MRMFWTVLAIAVAAMLQSGLGHISGKIPFTLDPFLLVVLYCGLTYGETHGMLAGTVAGWVQDVLFGGQVAGLSGLTKLLVGFVVGLAGTRFLLVGPAPQILVIFASTIVDSLIFQSLASVFSVRTDELSAGGLAIRAGLNAVVGVLLFTVLDRRVQRERFS
jgi:rod shape-determining protein MreD